MHKHMRFPTFKNMTHWARNHWIVLAVLTAVIAGGIGGFLYTHNPDLAGTDRVNGETTTRKEKPLKPTKQPAPLTGVKVKPKAAQQPVTGVMIENSPAARPQTGLDAADIVFEAVVEGGITRFMALYQSKAPGRIGPVRSLRPYFLDWVMGFDAPIAHVGGSAEALQLADRRSAKDLDQFAHNGPYYRNGSRPAPHNMYSSVQDLRDLQKRLGYTKSEFASIPHNDGEPAQQPDATRITINYSSSQYQAQFRYQKGSNRYQRYMAGAPHVDTATGNPITVKNIVLIRMPTTKQGRYAVMETIGSGNAQVFKNGTVTRGTWRQESYDDRIKIMDGGGDQVPLNRGDSWFAILPSGQSVNY